MTPQNYTKGRLVVQNRMDGSIELQAEDCTPVGMIGMTHNRQANAERLAHCWNMHEELVSALQPFTLLNPLHCPEFAGSIEQALTALAHATREEATR